MDQNPSRSMNLQISWNISRSTRRSRVAFARILRITDLWLKKNPKAQRKAARYRPKGEKIFRHFCQRQNLFTKTMTTVLNNKVSSITGPIGRNSCWVSSKGDHEGLPQFYRLPMATPWATSARSEHPRAGFSDALGRLVGAGGKEKRGSQMGRGTTLLNDGAEFDTFFLLLFRSGKLRQASRENREDAQP